MKLLVIPIQSVTDLITNSSSEVFILNTDKTCEQVDKILNGITEGFCFPEIFHLKDYREWRKKIDSGELEESGGYPGSIFEIARDWFTDPENEEDMYEFKKEFLFYPWSMMYGFRTYGDDFLPVHEAFVAYINANWESIKQYLPSDIQTPLDKHSYRRVKYDIMYRVPESYIKEFINNYKEPVYGWELQYEDNVESLDGKVLVVSDYENSIPYDTWDAIYENFDGFNKHLG